MLVNGNDSVEETVMIQGAEGTVAGESLSEDETRWDPVHKWRAWSEKLKGFPPHFNRKEGRKCEDRCR